MVPNERQPIARFPTRCLTIAMVFTALVLTWLGWGAYQSYQATQITWQQHYAIEQLRGTIVHLDEVLTMSAQMAAATGDPQWKRRYDEFEPQLDRAIQQATALAPEVSGREVTAQTEAANLKLVEMENRAFALVEAGNLEEAQSVLSSEQYETQKRIYAEGMTRFADLLGRAADDALRAQQKDDSRNIVFAIIVGAALLAGWVFVLLTVRSWRKALLENNRRLAQQTDELASLNAALAQKVEQLEDEITERARAEERIHHLNAVLRAIRNVNQLISREKDRDRLLQGACESLIETRGYRGISIVLLDDAHNPIATAEAGLGEDSQPLPDLAPHGPLDDFCEKVLSRPGAVLIDEPSDAMAVRLEHAGEVCGLMVASVDGDLPVEEEEQRLFEEVAGDIAFALNSTRLEAERKQAEESLRLEQSRLEALLKLNQMTEAAMHEITGFALEEAVRLTQSEIGYLAFMNEDETVLTMHAWSKTAMDQCAIVDKPIVYPLEETGLWGEAVRRRKPVITNDYAAPDPCKKGCPEGHVEVVRHMNVPVFDGAHIVAVAGVGNKRAPYDDSDVRELTLLMQGMHRLIQRKQAENDLRKARDELEIRVDERTAQLAQANDELRREIAEREQAEKDLAYERFLLVTLMDYSPDYIYFKDDQSRFIRISKALATYFGYSEPSRAIGQSDLDIFDPQHAEQYLADEREVMKTGESVVGKEEEQAWPDGAVTWVSSSKVPLRDDAGKVIGTFGISRDITARKQAEAQLQGAKEAAEAANRAKSDFLANMSHEIRTPMNAIIGMTELVLDTELTGSQRDYLRMVRESGDALLAVINDVLDFSKIEAGKLDLDPAPFDLRETLGDTMKSLGLRAHSKELELACHIHPEVPDRLLGDAGRLRQIAVNLVGNAIKFTETGEVLLEVRQQSQSDDHTVLHFTVTDTGIGIPEEKRKVIFDVFEQVDSSTTRRFGGTGLGLAISSKLVSFMDGRIWVESQLGRGSTFHFTARFELPTGDDAKALKLEPAVVRDTRVLVVDDNATNRHILQEMLANWGMKPTSAAGAEEALRLLPEAHRAGEPFTLVLTDANMPNLDGFALAERIKQDPDLKSTIIMMLTSGDRSGDTTRCAQLEIASYLLKPVKQSELFDAIVLAMGIATAEDEADGYLPAARSTALRPLKILLAEDSLVNQKLAVGLLEKYGHTVVVANHGREAVAAFESQPFDLILMDVQMPELDGFEATGVIRAEESRTGAHMPIIAMTAHAMKGDRERCLEAGMDGYIAKPIHANELFDTMEAVVTGSGSAVAPSEPAPSEPTPPEAETARSDGPDWSVALKAVRGNRDLLKTVVETVLAELPPMMTAIRQAIGHRDAAELRLAAHTLRGSIRYFGSTPAAGHAAALEQFGEENRLDDAETTLAALDEALERLNSALLSYMQSGGIMEGL